MSKKKPFFPINDRLNDYLSEYFVKLLKLYFNEAFDIFNITK
jgi:hypothetical protein